MRQRGRIMFFLLIGCQQLISNATDEGSRLGDGEEAHATASVEDVADLEFVVAGTGDVRTVTATPGTLKFRVAACDPAQGVFAVRNDTESEITVNATMFGNDSRDLGFGIEPLDSDIVGIGLENGLWMARAYRVAPGERSARGVVYEPSLAVSRLSRGGVVLSFGFGEPELDDPDGDGFNDNVGGIVALVGEAFDCEPSSGDTATTF